MRIAIVGATGLVGTIILEELASGDFDIEIEKIVPMASHRSAGSSVEFSGEEVEIIPLDSGNIPPVDIAFFAVEDALSKKFAPIFVQRGATVIDKSNAFRRDEKVPLVVPEVNGNEIGDAKIIASPNCSTIQLVMALAPLKKFGIKSVWVSTYQAISGAGKNAVAKFIEEWEDMWDWLENKDLIEILSEHPYKNFSPPAMFSNVIPQIGTETGNGCFTEEDKLQFETKKILQMPELYISATAVRVPVLNVHSEAVSIEFFKNVNFSEIEAALKNFENLIISEKTLTPVDVSGRREIFVSRLRMDSVRKDVIHLWIMGDNIRKGAATNAIQIAEILSQKQKH
ncbi:aspartate-semialdehyde dehydrogenase [bacterium]|nr:aspartate-semialdehyde dehydrogenase [bacterium]